jgi:hypothetical protein
MSPEKRARRLLGAPAHRVHDPAGTIHATRIRIKSAVKPTAPQELQSRSGQAVAISTLRLRLGRRRRARVDGSTQLLLQPEIVAVIPDLGYLPAGVKSEDVHA